MGVGSVTDTGKRKKALKRDVECDIKRKKPSEQMCIDYVDLSNAI